jgi:hypothetical protein
LAQLLLRPIHQCLFLMRRGAPEDAAKFDCHLVEGKRWLMIGNGQHAAISLPKIVVLLPKLVRIQTRASDEGQLRERARKVMSHLPTSACKETIASPTRIVYVVEGFQSQPIEIWVEAVSYLRNSTHPKCASITNELSDADIVSVHLNGDDESLHGLFNANFFRSLKGDAVFINTTRAELMDEDALLESLERGSLRGVATDVLPTEAESLHDFGKSKLWSSIIQKDDTNHDPWATLPNLLITPHVGGDTRIDRARIGLFRLNEFLRFINRPTYKLP